MLQNVPAPERFCRNCGRPINPDNRFCSECGHQQPGVRPNRQLRQSYNDSMQDIYSVFLIGRSVFDVVIGEVKGK